MPKKKESIIEKVEEEISEVAEKIVKEVKKLGEKLEDDVEDVPPSPRRKSKKTLKKETSSDKETSEKENKLAKLKEKAEKLAKGIKDEKVDLKKKLKAEPEETKNTLAPIEDYLKSSIHLGTRAITPDMKPYVYKRRADSLAVFNTALLDEKIREGAEFLAKYAPEQIIVVCKREAGAKVVEMFSEVTGIKVFAKKYPAGILTNPNLENFIETDLILICDPWTDKAALEDAKRIKIPVMAICDTNNYTMNVDKVIPGNNKSAKSLGMIFYLLAKLYSEKRKLNLKVPPISEWIENWD